MYVDWQHLGAHEGVINKMGQEIMTLIKRKSDRGPRER